jgi:hypothetical protein
MTAEVDIPEIAKVSTSVSTQTSFTNENSKTYLTFGSLIFIAMLNKFNSNTQSQDSTTKLTLKFEQPEGKPCYAVINTTECTQQATGTVSYLASGWVWFNYNDKTHDHYKCMLISTLLSS